jgi:hypothetical protein
MLIGLTIRERGKDVADAVVVDLAADFIAAAVDAAEDADQRPNRAPAEIKFRRSDIGYLFD